MFGGGNLYWVSLYLENWVGECSRHLSEYGMYCYWAGFFRLYWVKSIEIIDIECVLLSLLSKNFVSTKWRIYKGILASPRLLRREFRAVARSAIVFFCQAKFTER